MIERYPVPDEAVTMAWEAAHKANEAHDNLRSSIGQLSLMEECAKLEIDGVEITDEAMNGQRLEIARVKHGFDIFAAMASPVMLDPTSPFRSSGPEASAPSEQAGSREVLESKLLHTEDDLRKFGIAHGYHKNTGGRVWTALTRSGQPDIENAVKYVTSNFDAYEAMDPETRAADYENKIVVVTSGEDAHDRFMARIRKEDTYRLDVRSMYDAIRAWGNEIPNVRDFGPKNINFLSDYANHTIPDLEIPLRTDRVKGTQHRY